MLSSWRLFFTGILLGIAAVLPGALGTILAVSLGIYEPLIAILASPLKKACACWRWLLPLAIGTALGWLLFIGVIAKYWLKAESQIYLLVGVLGLVCGLLPHLLKQADVQEITFKHLILACCGFFSLLMISNRFFLSTTLMQSQFLTWQLALFSGAVLGIGGLVPGFSASLLLISLNLFGLILRSLTVLSPVLFFLLLAYLLAILLGANLMKWLLFYYHAGTYYFFFGLAIACLWQIWPALPLNISGLMLSLVFFIALLTAYYFGKYNHAQLSAACKQ